jgi:hypothetical protein
MFTLEATLDFKSSLNQQFDILPKITTLKHIKDTLSPYFTCDFNSYQLNLYELDSSESNYHKTKELQIVLSKYLSKDIITLLLIILIIILKIKMVQHLL